MKTIGSIAIAFVLVACGSATASDDERGSAGIPPSPAVEYCTKLGYTYDGTDCTFPDGTSCDPWIFYYGTCGQAYSYCNTHGGTISSTTKDMGGWAAHVALCTIGGISCEEDSFFRTGVCNAETR